VENFQMTRLYEHPQAHILLPYICFLHPLFRHRHISGMTRTSFYIPLHLIGYL
jgi:hypothetical protein